MRCGAQIFPLVLEWTIRLRLVATMRPIIMCVLLLGFVGAAAAQGTVYKLEPRKVVDIPQGKAVMVNGKAGPAPHRFLLDNVNILMPVVVTLRPERRGDDINLRITKLAWDQPLREGSTKSGQVSFKFRTESEFQISVDATKPDLPYKLLVWVGDELKAEAPPVVVPKSQFKDDSGGGLPGGVVAWVIAAALIGIFVLLAIMLLRRRQSP
jgi:hypothetical protein